MNYKEQLYIAAETYEADYFTYSDLFDGEVNDYSDCDGNMVTTIYTGTVANAFKLRIEFDECPYDNYSHTCMYLDCKEIYSGDGIATPIYLNNILIKHICEEPGEINIQDTL